MRPLLVLALSTRAVGADPAPKTEPVPAAPVLPYLGSKGTGAPGVNDVWAAGIVIDPGVHPDQREWPNGMVITPPPSPDFNVLELGTLQLPTPPARTWQDRLSRVLGHGLRGLAGMLEPTPSL